MPAHARTFRTALLTLASTAIAASVFVTVPAHAEPTPVAASSATVAPATGLAPQQTLRAKHRVRKANARLKRAMAVMRAQTGDPYRYGSAGPNAFDCSGLVFFATHAAGFKGVPRTSSAQAGYMRRVSRNQMKPGDFVFFNSWGRVYHVGMYVGGNRILHAPYSGARVRTDRIWTNSWFGGTLRGRG